MWLLNRPVLVVSDAITCRKVLDDPNLDERMLVWTTQEAFQGKGMLFASDQEYHKTHRGFALKGLMKTSVLRNTTKIIHEKMKLLVNDIETKADADGATTMEITGKIHKMTLDIIGKLIPN
jgi:hypothetical protein